MISPAAIYVEAAGRPPGRPWYPMSAGLLTKGLGALPRKDSGPYPASTGCRSRGTHYPATTGDTDSGPYPATGSPRPRGPTYPCLSRCFEAGGDPPPDPPTPTTFGGKTREKGKGADAPFWA